MITDQCLRFVFLLITRAAAWLRLSRREERWKTAEILIMRPNFTAAFDLVLAGAGIRTVLCNIRTPCMNAIAERWIGGCRRELLDRALIWNPAHLRRILRDYKTHHNQHRPHRTLNGAAPLKPLPGPVGLDRYRIRRQAQAGGLINEYRLVA
jgi:putative transposase